MDWNQRRKCPGCPYGGSVAPGVRHTRCDACRADHTRAKAADAQWDRRERKRTEADDRRRREGRVFMPDPQVRPRTRTPAWDQYGREVQPTPRLTPTEAQALRVALDDLDRAVRQVRKALDRRR